MDTAEERLRRLFAKPGLARLLDALQRRFERGIAGGSLTLPRVGEEERQAIGLLLGRRSGRGDSLTVPLADLEAGLVDGGLAGSLREAVEQLRGPLRDRTAERRAEEAAWDGLFATAVPPPWDEWRQALRRSGLLKRLARGEPAAAAALLRDALAVLAALPGHGQTLSTLAAATLGDAHALDPGRPVATLVHNALSRNDEAENEEGERARWARHGVLVGGAITSTVLLLNLPAGGDSFTARTLRDGGGQPLWLTLRQLVRDPVDWSAAAGTRIYVCENPAVVAEAAERLGERCRPLLCTAGQPTAAVLHLLARLHQAGATLAYHGDFDWAGIVIANTLFRRLPLRPWRFDAAAYRAAAAGGKPLGEGRVEACWDAGLAAAMAERGVTVEEEAVLAGLLGELAGEGISPFPRR